MIIKISDNLSFLHNVESQQDSKYNSMYANVHFYSC